MCCRRGRLMRISIRRFSGLVVGCAIKILLESLERCIRVRAVGRGWRGCFGGSGTAL